MTSATPRDIIDRMEKPSPRTSLELSPEAFIDPSPTPAADASPATSVDPSPTHRGGTCAWCRCEIESTARGARFCSKACRQTAFRLRRRAAALRPSLVDGVDASPMEDASSLLEDVDGSGGVDRGRRRCRFCDLAFEGARADAIFCGKKCRQVAFLARRRDELEHQGRRVMRFAYADPPYPGLASYYKGEPTFAGEVDHARLIRELSRAALDGWALSTSSDALADILPLCPRPHRVCAWVKPHGVPKTTRGLHSTWEAVIVVGGRRRRPGVRDSLVAHAARGGGTLLGRKPLAFVAFLAAALGMDTGDELADLFPGTGVVARGWRELGGVVIPSPLERVDG